MTIDEETYALQMSAISTAATGYWRRGDSIAAAYRTVALDDVARLYDQYEVVCKERQRLAEALAYAEQLVAKLGPTPTTRSPNDEQQPS